MSKQLLSKEFLELVSENIAHGIVLNNNVRDIEYLVENSDVLANEIANFIHSNKYRIAAYVRKNIEN